jgi:uncharacterized SAM-binding protein YcdF (DUF218 family)
MERCLSKRGLLVLVLFGMAVACLSAQSLNGKTMYVAVKSSAVKGSTGFFASTVVTLAQGDQVKVLTEKGNSVQVQFGTKTGWVSTTSLSAKRILPAGGASSSASAKELALAGKGFNEEVENAYKAEGKDLNYTAVDAVEAVTIPVADLQKFMVDGHLNMGGE